MEYLSPGKPGTPLLKLVYEEKNYEGGALPVYKDKSG
jgi:hypothetical protein